MITIESTGSFKNLEKFLKRMSEGDIFSALDRFAQEGVRALAANTPRDSGVTAASWTYSVEKTGREYSITWSNTNTENGFPVAIMLQYGHGTGNGGYVAGRDYINPALKPIFDKIADQVWKAVTSA